MKNVFIINPVAGKGQFQKELASQIAPVCRELKTSWEIYETKYPGDGYAFTKNYPLGEKIRFYAVGGDGTLNEIVNGAMARGSGAVGIFPCGSGNDFVRTFSQQKKFLDIKAQLQAKEKRIDILKTENSWGINMGNMGLDAQTAADVHRYTKFLPGPMAYSLSLLNRLLHKMGFSIKVTLADGEVIQGTYILATFANGIAYGGGYYSAPKARCDDGLMDICLVKPVSRLKIAHFLKIYKEGRHLDDERLSEFLVYRRSSQAVIETKKPKKFCLDGEIQTSAQISIKLQKQALDFLLPYETDLRELTPANHQTDKISLYNY